MLCIFCSLAIFHPLVLLLSLLECFDLFPLLGLFFFLLLSLYSTQTIIFVYYRKIESCHSTYDAFSSILNLAFSSCLQNLIGLFVVSTRWMSLPYTVQVLQLVTFHHLSLYLCSSLVTC